MNTFEKVCELIEQRLGVEASEVEMTSSFKEDLRADSLDVVEFVMDLEEVFGVEIPDEEAAELHTVGEVVRYIEERK